MVFTITIFTKFAIVATFEEFSILYDFRSASVTVPAHADNYKTERALSIWLLNILNLIKENSD